MRKNTHMHSAPCRLWLLCLLLFFPGPEVFAQDNPKQESLKTLQYYLDKGDEYKKQDNFPEAMGFLTKALTLSEKTKDSISICHILYSMGEINSKMGYLDRAVDCLQRGLAIAKALGNKKEILRLTNGIGLMQLDQKKYEASLATFNWLIRESLLTGDSIRYMNSLINLGNVYVLLKKNKEAKSAAEKALFIAKALNDTNMQALAYINIADCFRKLNKTDSAILFLKKAEQIRSSLSPYDQQILYGGLTLAYEDKKDYKHALHYFKEHFSVIRSIYSTYSDKTVNELEAKYQSEKRKKEILQLNLDKQQGSRALAEKQEALSHRTTLLTFAFILLFIILVFSYFLYREYRLKTTINRLLLAQNEEVNRQKKQIEDNLVYTQQLQEALKHDLNHYMQSALRKQMNPHFVFNSLNSIQRFILQNDKMLANEYLADFAKLMRRVLEHSRKDMIPLNDELESLELYIRLEQRRFENKFEYELSIDETITPAVYLIPPFLLQPHVENAIWHGLLHKNSKGHLKIRLLKKDAAILCSIIDNGIGRTEAALKKAQSSTHESLATKITEKRVEAMNSLNKAQISIVIEDLLNEEALPAGTAVHISIPLSSIFQTSSARINT